MQTIQEQAKGRSHFFSWFFSFVLRLLVNSGFRTVYTFVTKSNQNDSYTAKSPYPVWVKRLVSSFDLLRSIYFLDIILGHSMRICKCQSVLSHAACYEKIQARFIYFDVWLNCPTNTRLKHYHYHFEPHCMVVQSLIIYRDGLTGLHDPIW